MKCQVDTAIPVIYNRVKKKGMIYMTGKIFTEEKTLLFPCQENGAEENGQNRKNEQFGFLADRWLNNARFHVKESSYVKYHNLVKNHIIPTLGEINFNEFTTKTVEVFVEEKLKNGRINGAGGLSEKTVKDMLVILKEICAFAACENIDLPCHLELVRIRTREKEICILEKQEQIKLEKFLMSSADLKKTGILLSLYMGLRIGEVCALKREHLKLETGVLQIRGTMQRIQNVNTDGEKKTRIIVTEPKSFSSVRDIPIPDFLLERLQVIENAPPQSFVLSGTPDRYIEPRTMENIFKTCLRKCQIRNINYHALRHTFATRCVECGFDVKSLSEILGHSSVNITLDRYVHSSMEQKRRNMERLKMY